MALRPGRERGVLSALERPAVLAVSGGADSMLMAAALHAADPSQVLALATFDHGTGAAAAAAVEAVRAWGSSRGIRVHVGQARDLPRTEAAWRSARWTFLRELAAEHDAPVATAHTEDDQAETVFMRLLRGSGVRGLAGLLAPSTVLRPLLHLTRVEVRALAVRAEVPFINDPSNADLRHLRNRVRLELLPALERVTPGFRAWLLRVGREAAAWRADVARAADLHWRPAVESERGIARVPRDRRRLPTADEAALFWPEVAGRLGIPLDRRGTARLASFTTKLETGLQMPLSGGVRVTSDRDGWSMERAGAGG
ncbi:MAG: tRNA lysidine(34) synthetase TilS [Gemmatimonadota bacterium]